MQNLMLEVPSLSKKCNDWIEISEREKIVSCFEILVHF